MAKRAHKTKPYADTNSDYFTGTHAQMREIDGVVTAALRKAGYMITRSKTRCNTEIHFPTGKQDFRVVTVSVDRE